jgi:hypothetical protein
VGFKKIPLAGAPIFSKEGLNKIRIEWFLSPTNVAPSLIFEGKDYGLKKSIDDQNQ